MTYNNAVKHLRTLKAEPSGGIELIRSLLEALGSPQRQIKFIRICGDSGKTSCAQMLISIFSESSCKVGYYCPHGMGDPRESIRIGEKSIPHAEFADVAKRVFDLLPSLDADKNLSQSDLTFIISLVYFASVECDAVIIERRLRGNTTPFVESPMLSIITSIFDVISPASFEELIPRGITETITCIQHKQVYSDISNVCADVGCRLSLPLYADLEINKISLFNTRFLYRGEEYSIGAFSPCQLLNAITVIEAAHALARLGLTVSDNSVKRGLSNAHLPLMCQVLAIDPTIIVAGVESEGQLETLIASLAQVSELVHNKLNVFVSLENKALTEDLPTRLSNCSIECNEPQVLDSSDVHSFNAELKDIVSPIIQSDSTHHALLFIGSREYISGLASQVRKILGSFV